MPVKEGFLEEERLAFKQDHELNKRAQWRDCGLNRPVWVVGRSGLGLRVACGKSGASPHHACKEEKWIGGHLPGAKRKETCSPGHRTPPWALRVMFACRCSGASSRAYGWNTVCESTAHLFRFVRGSVWARNEV